MGLIDSHTHLESFVRHGTLAPALDAARSAGLEALITIGTAPASSASFTFASTAACARRMFSAVGLKFDSSGIAASP